MPYKHGELTEAIIGAFYTVYNALGYGFLEKVYENALVLELRRRGCQVAQQAPIQVTYAGVVVGDYFADLLVAGSVIVEVKTVATLLSEHEAQLVNYLRATDIDVGLLLNFGPHPQVKRKICQTARRQ